MASDAVERESMEVDVLIIGGGPAGLSAAIRLMQLSQEKGEELSVIVLEKGGEIGAHILSGVVVDPVGLDTLIPDWRERDNRPLRTEVTGDKFKYLGPKGSLDISLLPMPGFFRDDDLAQGVPPGDNARSTRRRDSVTPETTRGARGASPHPTPGRGAHATWPPSTAPS